MVAISKYRDGYRKAKSYTKEEIQQYYNDNIEDLSCNCRLLFERALRDEAQGHKGVSDCVLYEMLKSETDQILFLDELSSEEIRNLIRKNPYHLTVA